MRKEKHVEKPCGRRQNSAPTRGEKSSVAAAERTSVWSQWRVRR